MPGLKKAAYPGPLRLFRPPPCSGHAFALYGLQDHEFGGQALRLEFGYPPLSGGAGTVRRHSEQGEVLPVTLGYMLRAPNVAYFVGHRAQEAVDVVSFEHRYSSSTSSEGSTSRASASLRMVEKRGSTSLFSILDR